MNDYFNSKKWKKFISENKKYSVEEGCGDMPPLPPVSATPVDADHGDDHEGEMARSQLQQAAEASASLMALIQDGENLPAWVQAKLTKASDYLDSVRRYMEYKEAPPAPVMESATWDALKKAFGGSRRSARDSADAKAGDSLSQYSEEAIEAAKAALETIPDAGIQHGAALENEIHHYLETGFGETKRPREIFKIADEALAVAGIILGLGPDAL